MKRFSTERKTTPAGSRSDLALHFVYSFACNLLCGHCIYRCGPERTLTMAGSRAEQYIVQAARAGIRHIVFNGGEPFLHFSTLCSLVGKACEQGVRSTVVSNGSWAVSLRKAMERLAALKDAGLHSITLSTDRYHLTFVPEKQLYAVLTAAGRLGIRTGVKIARLPWDPVADGLFRSLRRNTARIVMQPVSPLGRASFLREALPLRAVFHLSRPGCLTPPVLLPDGRLLTCCNLPASDMSPEANPFILGSLDREPLEHLLTRRRNDPLLRYLRREGPQGLYVPLLAAAPENAALPPSFFHDGCDLCFHLFRESWARTAAYTFLAQARTLKKRAPPRSGPFTGEHSGPVHCRAAEGENRPSETMEKSS